MPERDLCAFTGSDEDFLNRFNRVTGFTSVADLDAVAFPSFDGGGDNFTADCGLDGLVDVDDIQAVAFCGLAVGVDFEVGFADDTVRIDAVDVESGDIALAHETLKLKAEVLEGQQGGGFDFDAHGSAHPSA